MIPSTSDFDIISSAEIADVISHFTPEMIEDIITQSIAISSTFEYGQIKPNIVQAICITFQNSIVSMNEQFSAEVETAKTSAFNMVISTLCAKFNVALSPAADQNNDRFTLANAMYDFFVYRFDQHLITFLTVLIIRESQTYSDILNSVGGDAAVEVAPYIKKIFKGKNAGIGSIYANITWVLTNVICASDIEFQDIVMSSLSQESALFAKVLMENVVDMGDFFKMVYVPAIMNNLPYIATTVRHELQKIAGDREILDYIGG